MKAIAFDRCRCRLRLRRALSVSATGVDCWRRRLSIAAAMLLGVAQREGSGNVIGDGDERRRLANREFDELKRWVLSETDKVSARLDREGAVRGLDTNREAYAYIHDTFRRRISEIAAKYS